MLLAMQSVLSKAWDVLAAKRQYMKKDSIRSSEDLSSATGQIMGRPGKRYLLKTESIHSEGTAGGSESIREAMSAEKTSWFSSFHKRKKPSKSLTLSSHLPSVVHRFFSL